MEKSVKTLFVLLAVGVVIILIALALKPETQTNVDSVTTEPQFSTISEQVSYHENVQGYLARPEEEGEYPGVVMIHEWWGLNENIKQMADSLASQGYVVLAVDLYNGEVATESSRAGELAGMVRSNPQQALANLNSAVDYLQEEQNSDKIASLGWCFGGGQSLLLALNNNETNATVIYYGTLVTDEEQLSEINTPVLGIFGSEDSSIPVETVNEFDSALDSLEIENEVYIYEGVGHAFANPSGMNYAPAETQDAWEKTLAFLEENLKN